MSAVPADSAGDVEPAEELGVTDVETAVTPEPVEPIEAEPTADPQEVSIEPGAEAETDNNLESDRYLADLQRLSAEFSNFRKQADRRSAEVVTRARADLVERLLPILDSCDAAVSQGDEGVGSIRKAMLNALEPLGLEVLDPGDHAFDPTHHEAMTHEPAEEDNDVGPVVVEVLRRGYIWEGQVLRPAMVKVRG